jgi:hypothetical protein
VQYLDVDFNPTDRMSYDIAYIRFGDGSFTYVPHAGNILAKDIVECMAKHSSKKNYVVDVSVEDLELIPEI